MPTTVLEERTELTHRRLTAPACRRGGPIGRVASRGSCGWGLRSRQLLSPEKHAFARSEFCRDRRRAIRAKKPQVGSGAGAGSRQNIVGSLSFYDPTTSQFLSRDPANAITRSAYGYTYGNPLNAMDPSGLDSYNYTFDLGRLGTPEQLAAYANGRCSDLFPIEGCKSNFQVGDELPLVDHILFWSQSFAVKVINMTSTSWTFVATDGHPEGPGRTITFSFCQDDQGNNKLNISTSEDGSATVNWWGLRNINFLVAETKWQDFADNIRTNYRWSQNDGAGNPSDPGVWV